MDIQFPKSTQTSLVTSPKGEQQNITYRYDSIADRGTFGTVFRVLISGELCAVKKVLQDSRYRNREVETMCLLEHSNIVRLLYYYYEEINGETYLYMFMDYLPTNMANMIDRNRTNKLALQPIQIKLYMYQLFLGLNYLHSLGILHRDIKPTNLLLNPRQGVLKLCDFGNAKKVQTNVPNVAYICSRFYRAPELIFGAVIYTAGIDVWSAGCVLAECFLVGPLFKGGDPGDQLVRIIKVLGTPSKQDLISMRQQKKYGTLRDFKRIDLNTITDFGVNASVVPLLESIFRYDPSTRPTSKEVCKNLFFSPLFTGNNQLSSGQWPHLQQL